MRCESGRIQPENDISENVLVGGEHQRGKKKKSEEGAK